MTDVSLVQLLSEQVLSVSLSCVQDSSVIQLTQDLAKSLGLKIRKAYVRTKVHTPSAVCVFHSARVSDVSVKL